jgi:hypothetical protein
MIIYNKIISHVSRPWDELLKVKLLTHWSAVLGWVPFGLLETPRARALEPLEVMLMWTWPNSLRRSMLSSTPLLFSVFNSTVFFGFYF